jgi:hypothetical protein
MVSFILLTSIANRAGIDLATAVHRRSLGPGTAGLTHLSTRAPSTGFAELDLARSCMRAAIETGEVCRAVRELLGNPSDPQGRTVTLADTCADLALLIGAIFHPEIVSGLLGDVRKPPASHRGDLPPHRDRIGLVQQPQRRLHPPLLADQTGQHILGLGHIRRLPRTTSPAASPTAMPSAGRVIIHSRLGHP